MSLRELALIGQDAAWLPASLIHDDLRRGKLRPLDRLGRSVSMDIVVFFAVQAGDKSEMLMRKLQAAHDQARQAPGAAATPLRVSEMPGSRRKPAVPREARDGAKT